jgi:hypothetical protein
MRSARGFFAAIVLLSLLPVAVLYQAFFESELGLEIVTHLILGAGAVLISLAVFDFQTTKWITRVSFVSAAVLAAIFLLQALALVLQSETLTYFVFQILGQQLEKILGLMMIFWCAAMLFFDSRGKTKIFGAIVMTVVVCAQIFTYAASALGGTAPEELKLVLLLMFVWLLFESAKKFSLEAKSVLAN